MEQRKTRRVDHGKKDENNGKGKMKTTQRWKQARQEDREWDKKEEKRRGTERNEN